MGQVTGRVGASLFSRCDPQRTSVLPAGFEPAHSPGLSWDLCQIWATGGCGQPVESPIGMSAGRRLGQVHRSGGLHIHHRATSAHERTRTSTFAESQSTLSARIGVREHAAVGRHPVFGTFLAAETILCNAESRRVEHQRFHVDPLSRRSPSPSGITLQEMQVQDSNLQAGPSSWSALLSSRNRTGPSAMLASCGGRSTRNSVLADPPSFQLGPQPEGFTVHCAERRGIDPQRFHAQPRSKRRPSPSGVSLQSVLHLPALGQDTWSFTPRAVAKLPTLLVRWVRRVSKSSAEASLRAEALETYRPGVSVDLGVARATGHFRRREVPCPVRWILQVPPVDLPRLTT